MRGMHSLFLQFVLLCYSHVTVSRYVQNYVEKLISLAVYDAL